jgi:DNA-binding SARP family transcriptional activator
MQVGAVMLTIRLLGEMAVLRDGEALPLPPSRKTRALLGYLVATGRPQRREKLCTMLWEVPDDPRGALRWSLSKLRGLVDEPDGPARILAGRETVSYVPEGARCDFRALRETATRPLESVGIEALRAVVDDVDGEFLAGLELSGQPDFQAWCLALPWQNLTFFRGISRSCANSLRFQRC